MEKAVTESIESLSRYVSARLALTGLSVRRALFSPVVWALFVLWTSGVWFLAVAFLLHGLAGGVGEFMGRPWLGYTLIGVIAVPGVALLVFGTLRRHAKETRRLKSEIVQARNDLACVFRGLDPVVWSRAHPWQSTGAAALGGFLVAGMITPCGAKDGSDRPRAGEGAMRTPIDDLKRIAVSEAAAVGRHVLEGALTPIVIDFLRESRLGEALGVKRGQVDKA